MPFIIKLVPFGLGPLIMLLFIINVAFGRVFFMCHYIGDTVGGAILGILAVVINSTITTILV